jgi:hypothetical protein
MYGDEVHFQAYKQNYPPVHSKQEAEQYVDVMVELMQL